MSTITESSSPLISGASVAVNENEPVAAALIGIENTLLVDTTSSPTAATTTDLKKSAALSNMDEQTSTAQLSPSSSSSTTSADNVKLKRNVSTKVNVRGI